MLNMKAEGVIDYTLRWADGNGTHERKGIVTGSADWFSA
jgi:hypothetical protein